MQKVIAIDGPSGSGKSTMAKELARHLKILYIDTGAMYRGLALWAHKNNIAYEEGETLNSFLASIKVQYGEGESLISIDGEDLSKEIREHFVSTLASQFSQLTSVREFLISFQRELGQKTICVMEGRDIGTVVFPEAFCKVFVTASAEVRAGRRLEQLREQKKDESITLEQVLKDVVERDRLDTEREVSPLKVADGAQVLDTSNMNHDQVLDKLVNIAREQAQKHQLEL